MVRNFALFIALLFIGLLAVGWFYRDTEPVRSWLPAELRSALGVPSSAPAAKGKPGATGTVEARPDGLRKCRQGSQVLYTNGDCPKGSVEQGISGGAVNVMPAPGAAGAAGNSGGGGTPQGNTASKTGLGPQTLRDMFGESQGKELNDRKIDKNVGK